MSPPLYCRPTTVSANSPICLNMIVKNETPVIERLLRSVKDAIGYFVIVDTGSDDGTRELICRFMERHGVAGEVHRREWVNFGHNRQQALELAKAQTHCDWVLFIDADEELQYSDAAWWKRLRPGVTYQLEKHHGNTRYRLTNLIWIRAGGWNWKGVVHEYLASDDSVPREPLDEAWILYHPGEGVRSRGRTQREKFLGDAELLEGALASDPNDARSRFYLAQSYRDAGEYRKAYENYGLRAALGGWQEEVYVAACEKAAMAIRLGHEHAEVVAAHLDAYSLRPSRAEALWQLAAYCRERQRYAEGYLFAKTGKDIPAPADILFVRHDIYAWRLLDEFSICAYWVGRFDESAAACRRLLAEQRFGSEERTRIETNLGFALRQLGVS